MGRQSQLPPLAFEARPHSPVEHAVVPIVERGQRRVGVNLRGVAYQRCRVCCRAVVQELGSEAAAAEARVEEADGVVPTVSEANESEAAEAVEREAQLRHDLATVEPFRAETRQAVARWPLSMVVCEPSIPRRYSARVVFEPSSRRPLPATAAATA